MIHSKKRAVSLILSYALIIMMGMSFSIIVYSWLKTRAKNPESAQCPDGVSLIIKNYTCASNELNITVQNKGTFSVEGFIIKASNISEVRIGTIRIPPPGGRISAQLKPGEENITSSLHTSGILTFIEIQPYINQTKGLESKIIYCDRVLKQDLECP